MTEVISVKVAPRFCVLCGEPNDCAMAKREAGEKSEDPCWCALQSFPETLTKKADEVDGGASCICLRCLKSTAS